MQHVIPLEQLQSILDKIVPTDRHGYSHVERQLNRAYKLGAKSVIISDEDAKWLLDELRI